MTYNFAIDTTTNTARLEKPALIFVEGNHVDSNKRSHVFSRERVSQLVENTNNFINMGGRVPFQRDHRKDQANNIGDVESAFYTKEITESDLPIKSHRHLIGKMGVFVDKIVAKGSKVIEDIVNQNIKTLSAGIDPLREAFVEISATPIPAIIGPALFSRSVGGDDGVIYFESSFSEGAMMEQEKPNTTKGKAFSFPELEELNKNMEEVRKKYDALADGLFKILSDIRSSGEEELQGTNPIEASYNAIEHFEGKVEELFALTREEEKDKIPTTPKSAVSTRPSSSRPFPTGVQPSDFKRSTGKSLGFKL